MPMLPAGAATPRAPPRTTPKSPPPRHNKEAWGRWKEQRDDETSAEYLTRLRSVYGKERPTEPKTKEGGVEPKAGASSSAAPSRAPAAVPKAADYYEVDGGANGSGGAEVLGGKMGTQEKGEEEAHQGGMGTIMVKRSSRRSRS